MNSYYEKNREYRLAYMKARHERLLAEGMCPRCGQRPLVDGLHMCGECRANLADMRMRKARRQYER